MPGMFKRSKVEKKVNRESYLKGKLNDALCINNISVTKARGNTGESSTDSAITTPRATTPTVIGAWRAAFPGRYKHEFVQSYK